MSFVHGNYLYLAVLLALIFCFLQVRMRKRFFLFIRSYWFKKENLKSKVSFVLYLVAFSFLFFSFLDLRGKEEKIEANIPDQQTIIIIDSSASMLVEDVRPNRYKKAILMARHFVRSAVGHQIGIVLFSDTQKRLVPFTDDLDLLDARLSSLEKINITNGGSNITQALNESLQYFKIQQKRKEGIKGNVLLFTDSEENNQVGEIDIPDEINVAVVGIGTVKGGPIPVRDRFGVSRGNKKHKGQVVNSSLNEQFLKNLSSKIKNYRYWVAQSYNLPTEDILDFFRSYFSKSLAKGNITVRPVKAKLLIVPFVILFIASVFLSRGKTFMFSFLLLSFMSISDNAYAQEEGNLEEKEISLSTETIKKLDELKKGNLSLKEKVGLSEALIKEKDFKKAEVLYREIVNKRAGKTVENFSNKGISEYAQKKLSLAVESFLEAKRIGEEEGNKSLSKAAQQNLVSALQQLAKQKKEKKKKEEQEKKEDKKKKEDQKKDDKQKKGENKDKKENKDGEKKDGDQEKDKNKDQNKNGEKDKNNENQSKDGKDKEDDKKKNSDETKDSEKSNDKQKKKPQTLDEKEKEIKQKRKMTKVPAILKQLLNEDRGLQKKFLDTKTKENRRDKKDW